MRSEKFAGTGLLERSNLGFGGLVLHRAKIKAVDGRHALWSGSTVRNFCGDGALAASHHFGGFFG